MAQTSTPAIEDFGLGEIVGLCGSSLLDAVFVRYLDARSRNDGEILDEFLLLATRLLGDLATERELRQVIEAAEFMHVGVPSDGHFADPKI